MTSAAVRRTFWRIVSGHPDGQPPWVTALGEPGDVGWFGPGSAAWQVNGSLTALVGGLRALLMQACHPLALAGVDQHSDFRSDPLGRLQRTNRYLTTSTFGTTAVAEQTAAAVTSIHRQVHGIADDGRPYSAQDPRLLLWVHLGLTDSMLAAYQRFGGSPVDGDAYVADMGRLAGALGVADPPTSQRQLAADLATFRADVSGGRATRAVARFLRFPGRTLPVGAWAPYEVLVRAASDLLPDWAHLALGSRRRPAAVQALDAQGCTALLWALQAAVGQRSPAVELAHRRAKSSGTVSARGVDHDQPGLGHLAD